MRWMNPQAWYLIIPILGIFTVQWARARKVRATLQFSSSKLFQGIQPGLRARFSFLPNFFKMVALILAVIALARPQASNSKINKNVEGIDIMLALDVSDSMEIEDMEPDNRLNAAKSVIRKFIKGRTSDRIGLVIFAGEAFTKCPLTLDYDILLQSLDSVSVEGIKQGTAIGVALANAVGRMRESTAKSRVVVLLTDGENNSGTIDPETALDIAKGYALKVYTIGVGVNGQARLPVYSVDAFGRKVKHYQPIHSTVNDNLLQKIADETGGKYYRAVDTGALKKVFSDIDRLEKTKVSVNEYVKYTELFENWLLWALVFYLGQFFFSRTVLRRAP